MKSITVHNIEKELAQRIEREAGIRGLSLNRTIKELLALSLGHDKKRAERRKVFEKLAGIWTNDDLKEFEKNTKDFAKIDKEVWR